MKVWQRQTELAERLRHYAAEVQTDVPLSRYTSLHIGGVAPVVVWPHTVEAAVNIFNVLYEQWVPWKIMGAGSNLLVSDAPRLPWVVLKLDRLQRITVHGDHCIEVEAGTLAPKLTSWCAHRGIGGLEFLSGIPGQIGGVVRMNAGAFGDTVGRHLHRVRVWDPDRQELVEHAVTARDFGYRHSPFQGNYVVLSADLQGTTEDPQKIVERLQNLKQQRLATQPLREPSAGCAFKNPNHGQTPAGRLLEQCGLKGFCHGGARFSEVHANFIINSGNATFRDVSTLLQIAQQRVFESYGVWLEPELVIWHDDPWPGDEPWMAFQ